LDENCPRWRRSKKETGAVPAPIDIDVGAATQAMLAAVVETVANAMFLMGMPDHSCVYADYLG